MIDIVDLYTNQKKTIKEIYELTGSSYGTTRLALLNKGVKLRSISKRRGITDKEKFYQCYTEEPMSGCWLWISYIAKNGYGYFWIKDRKHTAHRASVILEGREIPQGMEVDHICTNRSCVNPAHLRIVTKAENLLFRKCGPKEKCMKGHIYTKENTIFERNGVQRCRICRTESRRKKQESK